MPSDIKAAVIRFTTPGSTGNQTVPHGLPWTPKVAFFIVSRTDTDPTRSNAGMGFGAGYDSTNEWGMAGWAGDANPVPAYRMYKNASSLFIISTSGINDEGGFQSTAFDATNIYLNWSTANNSGFYVVAYLFGGADLEYQVGTFQIAVGGGTVSPSTSFEPDLILFACAGNDVSAGHGAANTISFGWARRSDLAQGCISQAVLNNTNPSAVTSRVWTNRVGCQLNAGTSGAHAYSLEVTAIGTTTFTVATDINLSEPGTDDCSYLALKLGDRSVWVGSLDAPDAADDPWSVTSPGFRPQLVSLGIGVWTAANTTFNSSLAAYMAVCGFDSRGSIFTVGQFLGDNITPGSGGMQAITTDDLHLRAQSGSTSTAVLVYDTPAMTPSGWQLDGQTTTDNSYVWAGFAIEAGDSLVWDAPRSTFQHMMVR